MKKIIIAVLLFLGSASSAQVAPHKYFIGFTDKNNTPYSLDRPDLFLSQRAIQRRQIMQVGYDMTDLPVNPGYLNTLASMGAVILNPTKWLNGTTIYLQDTSLISQILALPFVKSVVKNLAIVDDPVKPEQKFDMEERFLGQEKLFSAVKQGDGYDYGQAFDQVHMIGGDQMHVKGFRGQGVVIAVLDAGFYNVPTLGGFDSLRANNQLLGTRDFVRNGYTLYDDPADAHGMYVLSAMAALIPGQIIGTAPKASYWLVRTEDRYYEYLTEEYNWVSGAEFADSVGADIIQTSLGYTVFDSSWMSHSCADMNGKSTIAAIGANLAFAKGLIVVASAGNEGDNPLWRCLGTPADADRCVAVAAVDANGVRASFSSVGVDTAGRIKPNVAAMGLGTALLAKDNTIRRGNGTSYAAPLISGMTACLIQARPGYRNTFYNTAIERSCSHYTTPDSLSGYGIPDFIKAMNTMNIDRFNETFNLKIFPNPFTNEFTLLAGREITGPCNASLSDAFGRIIDLGSMELRAGENWFNINELVNLPTGVYVLWLDQPGFRLSVRILKSR